jgi:hypothetical protein
MSKKERPQRTPAEPNHVRLERSPHAPTLPTHRPIERMPGLADAADLRLAHGLGAVVDELVRTGQKLQRR